MKKLLGAVVGAIALMASGLASAAPVDIIYYTNAASNGSSANQLTLDVEAGVTVGYISIVLEGATSFTPGSGANISLPDSVLNAQDGFLTIISPAGATMVPAGTTTSVGTLLFASAPGSCGPRSTNPAAACTAIRGDIDFFGVPAILDVNGAEVVSSISIVPEPSTLALLGLGLASMALIRRKA